MARDQIGGSAASSCFIVVRRNGGKLTAEIDKAVDSKDANAAAIGEDGEPLPFKRGQTSKRFGGGKQFVEIEHPQQPGAAERGFIDRVRIRPVRRYASVAAFAPWAWRPDLITSTGLMRAAARAADMNLRASWIDSMYSKIARVPRSTAK